MAKLSYTELKSYVASVVTASNLSNATFNVTRDNIVGLVDKIGKIITLDSMYAIDKLAQFDGEYLSFGKTIEEWQQDLIMPEDYDPTGANALAPNDPTYRPNFYSYSVGKKVIPTTLRSNNIERAVHFVEQLVEISAMQIKRVQDSMSAYRYQVKREMLAKFIGLVLHAYNADSDIATFVTATAYNEGTVLKNADTPTAFGIVVKKIPASPAIANWDTAVSGGYIIVYSLITELAIPTDDSTGEAFVESVKKVVEVAGDLSEGNSLNGNSLGAIEGLTLILRQGIEPVLDVQTLAGAFHQEKLSLPANTISLKDFGSASNDVYAVLVDSRGMRLHNTGVLLDCARRHWSEDPDDKYCRAYRPGARYVQVSTDEVYGALGKEGLFTEQTPLSPNSPYSASKASADLLARAWAQTFGLPVNITRCSNNYGPYQFPEKLIPLMIRNCLQNIPLPVYGDGMQIRDWLYVEDHCAAIDAVLQRGEPGEVYNIGGNNEKANIEIVRLILQATGRPESLIRYVRDRPGHDRRYAIDNTKITAQLGWTPRYTFEQGMQKTVQWYLQHTDWVQRVVSGDYQTYYDRMYNV